MADSRRQNREIINYYLQVMDGDNNVLLGYLLDVSENGLLLQSHEPLSEPGHVCNLRLVLRQPVDGESELNVAARAVWSRKQPGSVFHHSGFEFQDPDARARRVIQHLMEQFAITSDA